MSEQKVPRSVEQRIVIKFLVGENVPSPTETLFPILLLESCLHTNQSRSYLNHLVLIIIIFILVITFKQGIYNYILEQTMFLGYIVLRLFCVCNLCYMQYYFTSEILVCFVLLH